MKSSRRSFIGQMGILAGGTALSSLKFPFIESKLNHLKKFNNHSAEELQQNEDFWSYIKQAYTESPNVINLNNGGVSPQPATVQETEKRYNDLSNEAPSYYMWRVVDKGREPMRSEIADFAGCRDEEIAFCRNTSEALETMIFGLPLEKGDEVVLCKQDYPNMLNAWKQREARDGIVLKYVNLELPIEDDDLMVQAYTNLFSRKTKLVHLTHMINWTGQILPVRKIADKAREKGIEVLVDSAHSFAHVDFKIHELNCDYLGTSLHKWLCAPFGTGMLHVRKEKIGKVWPLFAAPEWNSKDIRKFEHLGTRSFPAEMAIGEALDFHLMIGAERKEKRLHYLKNYWAEKVIQLDGVSLNTSLDPKYGCAIANVSIAGKSPNEVANHLFKEYKIHTVAIEWENISGVRITPHVYTSPRELDILVKGIAEIATD